MAGVIAIIPRAQFLDALGQPLTGGKLYTYLAGTTTPVATFQDQALSVKNENPIQLDATGSCVLWLDPDKLYKFVLKSANGVTVPGWPVDQISGAAAGSALNNLAASLAGKQGATQIGTQSPGGAVSTVSAKLYEDVKTSDYPTFAAALIAAAGKTLVVNSTVNLDSSTSIPTTTSVFVEKNGLIIAPDGVTLTVMGDFDAGSYPIFGGGGTIVFGVTSRARDLPVWRGGGQTAVFSTGRTLYQSQTQVGGPVHAFEDNATLQFTNPKAPNLNAYAAYDANTIAGGPGSYEHFVAFQARQTYNGSGEIWIRMDSFVSRPVHTGTGLVSQMTGMRVQRPDGTGPVQSYWGIYIEDPASRAAGANYAIFAEGGAILTRDEIISQGLVGKPAVLRARGNGSNGGFGMSFFQDAAGVGGVWQADNADMKFGVNNTEFMRLKANGRLKIGAPATVLTDNSLVEIQGTGSGALTLKATGGAGTGCSLNWNDATTGDALFSAFYTETSPTQRGSIDFNRAAGMVRYNTTSDATLKNLIGDANPYDSHSLIEAIRNRRWSWKDDPNNYPQTSPLAQELQTVFPGAVSVGGSYSEVVNGKPVTKYRPWVVDKTAPVWHLIGAHQYHTKQIADLQKLVADLSARLAAVEAKQGMSK